ncbi:replication initiator [Arsenicicoccus bolidensis]|uniref:replication initiator n=1 Tax=Arsenicicoccus bolidensis TaxID=229480 RepID=UPI0003F567DC|nr:replication initiator [Arsenicicoccus bolidensis]
MTVLDSHSGAPSTTRGAFPGFGEGAPLDLPSLTTDQQTGILSRLLDGTADAFADALASVGNCAHPIRLHGSSTTIDTATGEVLSSFSSTDAPLGVLLTPCGNRRAHACPACSRVYARDTFEVIRSGVVGGKTVPPTVAQAPLLFVTLTAPSFGFVHGVRPDGGRCRPRSCDRAPRCSHGTRLSCHATHQDGDDIVGSPLCWDCYDWTSAVVWQWFAPELWRRTTIAIRRALARHLGTKPSRLKLVASVQFAKVAEYQERGLIHFHALIRVDGPNGPGSRSPLDGDAFADVLRSVLPAISFVAPPTDEDDRGRIITWGRQLDIRTINHGPTHLRTADTLAPEQVAGYLAKYATKDSTDLRHGTSQRPHLARLDAECRRLHTLAVQRTHDRRSGLPTKVPLDAKTQPDPYLLLGKWAHCLGFRGHFATKSRRYSVTLGRLRRARERYRRAVMTAQREGQPLDLRDLEARLLADDDEETTLVVGSWTYAGTGWPRPGDAALAASAAARAREYDKWKAEQRKTTH